MAMSLVRQTFMLFTLCSTVLFSASAQEWKSQEMTPVLTERINTLAKTFAGNPCLAETDYIAEKSPKPVSASEFKIMAERLKQFFDQNTKNNLSQDSKFESDYKTATRLVIKMMGKRKFVMQERQGDIFNHYACSLD